MIDVTFEELLNKLKDYGNYEPDPEYQRRCEEYHRKIEEDFQEQYGNLVMWASVKSNIKPQDIIVDVRWTGDAEPNGKYIQTIQGSDGLVYHIYI